MRIFGSVGLSGGARSADPRHSDVSVLRERRAHRERERRAAHSLQGSLISLAALVGTDVKDPLGNTVGRLRDVLVHWTSRTAHPFVTAVLLRAGKNDVLIGSRWVEISAPCTVRLRTPSLYARAAERHPVDVALAHDVLDRQLVDSGGTQMVRPADVYLTVVDGAIELIGIEVGARALLRRLGPKRLRGRLRPERVVDWATVRSFSPARVDGNTARGRRLELAGQAGAGLALDVAAGEMHELAASEVQAALRASRGEAEDAHEHGESPA